jgi:hypothetical protein
LGPAPEIRVTSATRDGPRAPISGIGQEATFGCTTGATLVLRLVRNRVVFNIKGNDFRLIVAVAYQIGVVYVKFIGTHAQYDKVDAATVEME